MIGSARMRVTGIRNVPTTTSIRDKTTTATRTTRILKKKTIVEMISTTIETNHITIIGILRTIEVDKPKCETMEAIGNLATLAHEMIVQTRTNSGSQITIASTTERNPAIRIITNTN